MELELEGKVAVVTGGSRGIGAAIVTGLVEEGMQVVVNHLGDGGAASELQRSMGNSVAVFEGDVGEPASIEALVDFAQSSMGGLDLMVHNAGITTRAAIVDTPADDWTRVLKTNLDGAFHCARYAVKSMIDRDVKGTYIAITSLHGKVAKANMGAYCASKAAIDMMVRQLAVEVAPFGIRANTVAPGTIDTGMNPLYRAQDADSVRQREQLMRRVPLAQLGQPSAIANAVAFLASPRSSYTTGSVCYVDGGYTADGTPR